MATEADVHEQLAQELNCCTILAVIHKNTHILTRSKLFKISAGSPSAVKVKTSQSK